MTEEGKSQSSPTQLKERPDNGARAKAGRYLTFKLVTEEYGLEILTVQEIIGIMPVTAIPRMPEWVRGVINLRGKVIPVVELRLKFGIEAEDDTDRTCVIVVEIGYQGVQLTMGIIVDRVSEVLEIVSDQIEAAPSFGTSLNTEFILGMGKVEDKVITLLDIDNVLTTGELEIVNKVTKKSGGKAEAPDGCPLDEKQEKGRSKKAPKAERKDEKSTDSNEKGE